MSPLHKLSPSGDQQARKCISAMENTYECRSLDGLGQHRYFNLDRQSLRRRAHGLIGRRRLASSVRHDVGGIGIRSAWNPKLQTKAPQTGSGMAPSLSMPVWHFRERARG